MYIFFTSTLIIPLSFLSILTFPLQQAEVYYADEENAMVGMII